MRPQSEASDFEFLTDGTHHLYVNCKRCGSEANVEYLGLQQILTTCHHCNVTVTWTVANPKGDLLRKGAAP